MHSKKGFDACSAQQRTLFSCIYSISMPSASAILLIALGDSLESSYIICVIVCFVYPVCFARSAYDHLCNASCFLTSALNISFSSVIFITFLSLFVLTSINIQ